VTLSIDLQQAVGCYAAGLVGALWGVLRVDAPTSDRPPGSRSGGTAAEAAVGPVMAAMVAMVAVRGPSLSLLQKACTRCPAAKRCFWWFWWCGSSVAGVAR